jgi:hypothetical protein
MPSPFQKRDDVRGRGPKYVPDSVIFPDDQMAWAVEAEARTPGFGQSAFAGAVVRVDGRVSISRRALPWRFANVKLLLVVSQFGDVS